MYGVVAPNTRAASVVERENGGGREGWWGLLSVAGQAHTRTTVISPPSLTASLFQSFALVGMPCSTEYVS